MSEAERRKWDERYEAGSYAGRTHPSAYLAQHLDELPRGRALDVACGTGRNAIYLAAAGFDVDAVDISRVGLERAANQARKAQVSVNWLEADLEISGALPDREYDLIVIVRYVNLPLMTMLAEKLRPGGHLLAEQHLVTRCDVVGPRNPSFRLAANELLNTMRGLRILHYREGLVDDPDGRRAALAQLVACRAPARFDIVAGKLP